MPYSYVMLGKVLKVTAYQWKTRRSRFAVEVYNWHSFHGASSHSEYPDRHSALVGRARAKMEYPQTKKIAEDSSNEKFRRSTAGLLLFFDLSSTIVANFEKFLISGPLRMNIHKREFC